MDLACKTFRIAWLSEDGAASAHAEQCEDCARWVRASERIGLVLASVERLHAPVELDLRVAAELAGDRSRRMERVLGSLARRGAPGVLDERVTEVLEGRLSADERGSRKAQVLRTLDVHSAPGVLERLLREEMEAPERQRAERFAGSLERLRAPAALAERIGTLVRRRAIGRLVLAPLATLAAAGLVIWFATHGAEPARRYRFEVVHASSLDGLDPMARMLAESLNGGGAGTGGPR